MTQPINFHEAVVQVANAKHLSVKQAEAFLKAKMSEGTLLLTMTQEEFEARLADLVVA